MAGQTVVISVLADTAKATKGFQDVSDKAGGLGSAFKGAAIAVGVAAVAIGGFLAASVKAAGEAEKIGAQTAAVLTSTGAAAGRTAEQISGLAGELSKLSGVDDEVIQSGQNMLLTFTKIKGANFDKATEAALNLSVAMGKDMASSATLVGKALNDPIKGIAALSKVGVQLTEDQKATIKSMVELGDVAGAQAVILGELETQFGGSAAAFGNTYEGAIGKVKTAFGNLQESIGGALLPALTLLYNQTASFLTLIQESPAFQTFVTGLANLANGLLDGTIKLSDLGAAFSQGIQSAADWLSTGGITTIVNALISGREAMLAAALQVFPAIIEALITVVPQIISGVLSLVTSLVALLIDSAPALLGGAVTLLLGLVQGVVKILPKLITEIVALVPVIVTALVAMVPTLLTGAIKLFSTLINAVVTIVPKLLVQIIEMLPGILKALVSLIPQLIEGAISMFMALVNAIPVIIPALIQAVIDLIPIVIDTVLGLIPVLLDAAVSLFLAIVEALPIIIPALINAVITLIPAIIGSLISAIPKILEAGVKLFGGIISAVTEILPKLLSAGGNIVQGLWDGISGMWSKFLRWWDKTVGSVAKTITDALGIKSPSRVFKDIGKNVIRGLENGLSLPNKIGDLMSGLTDQVTGGFTATLDAPTGYRAASAGGGSITVNFTGLVTDPAAAGREVKRVLSEYQRSGGQL